MRSNKAIVPIDRHNASYCESTTILIELVLEIRIGQAIIIIYVNILELFTRKNLSNHNITQTF